MPEAEDLEPVYLTLEDALGLYADRAQRRPWMQRGTIRRRSGDVYKPTAMRSYAAALRLHILPELGGLEPITLHEDWGRYSPKARKPACLAGLRLLSGGGGI